MTESSILRFLIWRFLMKSIDDCYIPKHPYLSTFTPDEEIAIHCMHDVAATSTAGCCQVAGSMQNPDRKRVLRTNDMEV